MPQTLKRSHLNGRSVDDSFPEPSSHLRVMLRRNPPPPPSPLLRSHVVKTLKFGTQVPVRGRRAIEPGVELEGISTLEDRLYSIDSLHTAPHHYIKVSQSGGGLFRVVLSDCC